MPVDPAFLEDYPDELLIAELLKRCDHGVVSLYRVTGPDQIYTVRRWRGNSHLVAGLCTDTAASVVASVHQTMAPDTAKHDDWGYKSDEPPSIIP